MGAIIVSGQVTDSGNKGIVNVPIWAERQGRKVSSIVLSKNGGVYKLTINSPGAFDLVFDHSAWHPDVLKRLSEKQDHTIHKVLYRPGNESKMDAVSVYGVLSSYQYLYVMNSVRREKLTAAQLKERYGQRLQITKAWLIKNPGMIKNAWPLDMNKEMNSLIRGRAASVFRMYQIPYRRN
ncbi:MAG: hypothetical protein Tsb009_36000 [Planctomycetaceae bacterium]